MYIVGYWYPQIAVYDDVHGWVADPYLLEAEFYMEPADYDVRVTAPRGWVVGATGVLAERRLDPVHRGARAAGGRSPQWQRRSRRHAGAGRIARVRVAERRR